MIDALGRQIRLIIDDERDNILARNVVRRYNREFVPRQSRRKVNGPDPAARYWTAHRHTMQHAGELEIVNVLGVAGDFVAALFARNGLADGLEHLHLLYEKLGTVHSNPYFPAVEIGV